MSDRLTTDQEELAAFRLRVRTWLAEHGAEFGDPDSPGGSRRPSVEDEAGLLRARACQRSLFDAGLAGVSWPREYGGQGLGIAEQLVFNQETQDHHLPLHPFTIGFGMIGPTLIAAGTEEQKRRYLERMLRGDDLWCQMFSEPGAGSDLAGLRTRAVPDGDDWVLNGQKIWISRAQFCDYGLILTRTDRDAPKHQGLTMFVLDLSTPGVTIRPIEVMNGERHFNEIFLDDVRVPGENVVGGVGGGWKAALTTLMNERVALGAVRPLDDLDPVASLAELARREGTLEDHRGELVDLWLQEHVLRLLGQSATERIMAGAPPGPEGSVAKLVRTEYSKASAELALELVHGAPIAAPKENDEADALRRQLLYVPVLSIAGGTDEVLKNIIGERILGLPRER